MYKNEIYEMCETELKTVATKYGMAMEYYDADVLIEVIEDKEGRMFESVEDDILDSIYNGNWTDAAKQMHEAYITPHGLVDYVNDYRFEQYDEAYEHFDLSSVATITELYYRKEVA